MSLGVFMMKKIRKIVENDLKSGLEFSKEYDKIEKILDII